MHNRFLTLTQTLGRVNACDVQTLAESIFRKAVQGVRSRKLVISEDMFLAELDRTQAEHSIRQSARARFEPSVTSQPGFAFDNQSVNPPSFAIEHNVQNRHNGIQDDEASTLYTCCSGAGKAVQAALESGEGSTKSC